MGFESKNQAEEAAAKAHAEATARKRLVDEKIEGIKINGSELGISGVRGSHRPVEVIRRQAEREADAGIATGPESWSDGGERLEAWSKDASMGKLIGAFFAAAPDADHYFGNRSGDAYRAHLREIESRLWRSDARNSEYVKESDELYLIRPELREFLKLEELAIHWDATEDRDEQHEDEYIAEMTDGKMESRQELLDARDDARARLASIYKLSRTLTAEDLGLFVNTLRQSRKYAGWYQDFSVEDLEKPGDERAIENLYNPHSHEPTNYEERVLPMMKKRLFHTTDNLSFAEILKSGAILTDEVTLGGKQRTPGASFTDGDFSEALSFQLLYDDAAGGGKEKRLRSEKYAKELSGTHAENFVRYFWNNHRDDARAYLSELAKKIPDDKLASMGIDTDRAVTTEEQAIALSKHFVPKSQGDYGVTIAYNKEKAEELGIEDRGTTGLQKYFEKRSYRTGGVPLSEAETIFVPEAHVEEVERKLEQLGLSIMVKPVEELEARYILEKVKGRVVG